MHSIINAGKMRFFETKFLVEADEFIGALGQPTIKKILYNIDLAEQTNDPNFLRNYKMRFGNSEPNSLDYK